MLRVAFVPGISPDKWFRRWAERFPQWPLQPLPIPLADQRSVLIEGRADLCLVRIPDTPAAHDFRGGLHVIPLYGEDAVVVVPAGHEATAFDALSLADLEGEDILPAAQNGLVFDAAALEQVLDLVEAGGGVVLVPLSLARLHARKALRHRPVEDAPQHPVGLAWLVDPVERAEPAEGEDAASDPEPVNPLTEAEREALIEEFIGIVRGRTAQSSRGQLAAQTQGTEKKAAGRKGRTPEPASRSRQGTPRQKAKPSRSSHKRRGR